MRKIVCICGGRFYVKGTIKLNREFVYAYKRAKKVVTPVLVMHYYKNRTDSNKFGITVSKTIGKAHLRNRAKRLIREAYYAEKNNIKKGYNLVFVARARTIDASFSELNHAMNECIDKAELRLDDKSEARINSNN